MTVIEYKYPSDNIIRAERAVALGFFDGVHVGHRALLYDCVKRARESGLVPTVLTFPTEALGIKAARTRLYSTEEKIKLFEECGIMQTIVVDFASVSGLSPEDFVTLVLVSDLGARVALAGENFRFGHRAAGDATLLTHLMRAAGGDAAIHSMESCTLLSGERVTVSSSRIREHLSLGEVKEAAALLGAPYRILGDVVHGNGVGTALGFPTLNTDIDELSPIKCGVYRTELVARGVGYPALTNVGTCPTFVERKKHAETFIPGFSGDLYGERIEIRFLEFIREEREFSSPEHRLFLLCGTDMMLSLDTWYQAEEIFRLCYPVYMRRESDPIIEKQIIAKNNEYLAKYGKIVRRIPMEFVDISSTEIRRMVRAGEDITSVVPAGVAAYIERERLYV